MEIIPVLVIAAVVFGLCYLVDLGFKKLFRSQQQHMSGLAVRLSKRYGSIGLILAVLGLGAIFSGIPEELLLIIGGGVIMAVGIGLVVYYMSFGVFYDEDAFVLTTFGQKSKKYHYGDICGQKLYCSYGGVILIELFMSDGRTFQLQSTMKGAYAFLDEAFAHWLQERELTKEQCPFHDPDNSCWFPNAEDL